MPAVTVRKPDRSLIAVLGPLKMEVVQISAANDGDTYASKLVAPSFALFLPDGDMTGTAWQGSATVSGKTVTVRDPNVVTSFVLLVFGDTLR